MGALPNKSWYKAMDVLHSVKHRNSVISDIESDLELKNRIEGFRESFIRFACLERMSYSPDINEELEAYYGRARMYNYNVKKWISTAKAVFKRDNYTCAYCGQKGGFLEADHIVPFSKGGSDEMSNLTTSCRRCNRQKKDMSVEDFLKKKNKK